MTQWTIVKNQSGKTTPSAGRGGQFIQLISMSPGSTYQLKELATTSC